MQKWVYKSIGAVFAAALSLSSAFATETNAPAAAATATNRTCIMVCGDSVMKMLGIALERELTKPDRVRVVTATSIGSGLARLDLFNWHEQAKILIEREKPDIVITLIGSNDNQPMQTADSADIQENTPAWISEYTHRVKTCLEIINSSTVKLVVWMGLPDMRDPNLQAHVNRVNQIFKDQVAAFPKVVYFDTQRNLSREPGKFTMYLLGNDGMPIHIRASDGIHLNRTGAELLARKVADVITQRYPNIK